MKTCAKCKTEKPFEDFDLQRSRKGGRHPYCRSCRGSRRRKFDTTPTHDQPLAGEALRQAVIARVRQIPSIRGERDVTRWFSRGARLDDETIPECVQDIAYEVFVRSCGASPSAGVISMDRQQSLCDNELTYGGPDGADALVYGIHDDDDA